MKIIRVLLLMLVSCSSFAETPDFYKTICDTNLYSDNYLCIPYYQQNDKKLLVITYGDLQKAYAPFGFDKDQFRTFILRKLTNGDTLNVGGLDIPERNKLDFNDAERLFSNASVDSVLFKYYVYSGSILHRFRGSKSNLRFEYSLVYFLYKHKIISYEIDFVMESIKLNLTCSPYSNLKKKFADEYTSDHAIYGCYICIPFFDGPLKKIFVDLYGHLQESFVSYGFGPSEFKQFVVNAIDKGIVIDNQYLPKNACMAINAKIADDAFDDKTTNELLQLYYSAKTKHYFPPFGYERNAWVYTLFKRGILAYELGDEGGIILIRTHEIK